MDAFFTTLIEMIRRDARKPDAARRIDVDLSGAPACVRALADAMASSSYSIDLGNFRLVHGNRPIAGLGAAFEMAVGAGFEDLDAYLQTAGPGRRPLTIASTLWLADDGGGMSSLGVAWTGGDASLVIVEMEDPTEDNLVRVMSTPAQVFERLDLINPHEQSKDLEALRATFAPSDPAPEQAVPASRLRTWTGGAPSHPFAVARAHYAKGRVLQGAPTAGGAVVITRRVAAGTVTAALAVHRGGTTTDLDWPATLDVAAICPVPGRERVLVNTGGLAGDLLDVDLATGARRTVLEKVGWGSHFVDRDHLLVLAGGALSVYRWSDDALDAPITTVPAADLNNLFVAHGCAFGKTKDYQTTSFQVHRWNGAGLDDLGVHAIEPKLFTLHAAAAVDGVSLVAGVDMNDAAHWLVLDAA